MEPELWQKILLQAAGPLVSAVVGTLIIGTFVAWITRKAQARRADHQLRIQLIGQMTEAASSLYMATQHFWRKKDVEKTDAGELDLHRKELDDQYRASRVQGEVIERQLEAYFTSREPLVFWHATMDLLTVRYFHLIGLATDNLLRMNAGDAHTGLTVEQLKDQKLVLDTYREKLRACTQAVLMGTMRPMAG